MGIQELLLHVHPLFAAFVIPSLVVAALFVMPFIRCQIDTAGIWFRSPTGRRLAVFSAAVAAVITPLLIVVDEFIIKPSAWLPGMAPELKSGLVPTAERMAMVGPLLDDPVKGVRIEAARNLTAVAPNRLDPRLKKDFDVALEEFREAMEYSADFAASRINLGAIYAYLGQRVLLPGQEALIVHHTLVVGFSRPVLHHGNVHRSRIITHACGYQFALFLGSQKAHRSAFDILGGPCENGRQKATAPRHEVISWVPGILSSTRQAGCALPGRSCGNRLPAGWPKAVCGRMHFGTLRASPIYVLLNPPYSSSEAL